MSVVYRTKGGLVESASAITVEEARAKLAQIELAKTSLLEFMRYVWWEPHDFVVGLHTRIICARADQAVVDFKNGKSTFLKAKVPIRHGKSDMLTRAFTAYVKGRLSDFDPEIMIASYGGDLSEGFSRVAQSIIASEKYQQVFPHVRLRKKGKLTAKEWGVERLVNGKWVGGTGTVIAGGLVNGPFTGKGGAVVLCDDSIKTWLESESPSGLETLWNAFTGNLMTRRPDPCIVFVIATPWNLKDIFGRIDEAMAKDPDFPRFEEFCFPAEGGSTSPKFEYDYLFPELRSPTWYKEQRATLGRQAAGLLDCSPVQAGGNHIPTDGIDILEWDDPKIEEHGVRAARVGRTWDLASSDKELLKNDPDYTATAIGCVTYDTEGAAHLWVFDMHRMRELAPARNAYIRTCFERDGAAVKIGMESVAGYKDAYDEISAALKGKAIVKKMVVTKGKLARVDDMLPVFDAGHVHFIRGEWNATAIAELTHFPSGAHDDMVDGITSLYHMMADPPEFNKVFSRDMVMGCVVEQSPIADWAPRILSVCFSRADGIRYVFAAREKQITKVYDAGLIPAGQAVEQAKQLHVKRDGKKIAIGVMAANDATKIGEIAPEWVRLGFIFREGWDDQTGLVALQDALTRKKIVLSASCDYVADALQSFRYAPETATSHVQGDKGQFAWGGDAGFVRCLFNIAAYARYMTDSEEDRRKGPVEKFLDDLDKEDSRKDREQQSGTPYVGEGVDQRYDFTI